MRPEPEANGSREQVGEHPPACCPFYHEAVELIGRRWTGAIVAVLIDHGPLRFSEIAQAVPELSDRLLSERMKELEARGRGRPPLPPEQMKEPEARGPVPRHVEPGPPVRVNYELTAMGHELQPALAELR